MLSQKSVCMLIALVEAKLRALEVIDREDSREKRLLQSCHDDLQKMVRELEKAIIDHS